MRNNKGFEDKSKKRKSNKLSKNSEKGQEYNSKNAYKDKDYSYKDFKIQRRSLSQQKRIKNFNYRHPRYRIYLLLEERKLCIHLRLMHFRVCLQEKEIPISHKIYFTDTLDWWINKVLRLIIETKSAFKNLLSKLNSLLKDNVKQRLLVSYKKRKLQIAREK